MNMKTQHNRIECLEKYAQHLKSLGDKGRYIRFGYATSAGTINQ